MEMLARATWLGILFLAVELCGAGAPESPSSEEQPTLAESAWQAAKHYWPVEREPTISEMTLLSTLVPDPTYEAPTNLTDALSTQPGWEAAERPYRVAIFDSQGNQHFFLPMYHR